MPPVQPWLIMATGWEDAESSSRSNQFTDSFYSSRKPQYPANPIYVDTRRRFTIPATFETGQHTGVASSDPLERQPQQSR